MRAIQPALRAIQPAFPARLGVTATLLLAALACSGSEPSGPSAGTGSVRVTAATTGADLDLDGYLVVVEGDTGRTLEVNGAVTSAPVNAGKHTVALTGVAANCAVGGENPRIVSVAAGATTETAFSIVCAAVTGSIQVTASTSGVDVDPDGYTLAIDGGAEQALAANGTATFSHLSSGNHALLLAAVARNCAVAGDNPRTLGVTVGATTQTTFAVACVQRTASNQIAFHSDRSGNYEVYVVNEDGTGLDNLSNNAGIDGQPSWSPDGSKLVFISDRDGNWELYSMNADGTNQKRLTDTPATEAVPVWSPDGMKIAFTTNRDGNIVSNPYHIYVINADGTNSVRLTSADYDYGPARSPDGKQIAFSSDRDANNEIYVMNADGTNQTRLTHNTSVDFAPAWSPDGTQIAFHCEPDGDGNLEICAMNADGTNLRRLTTDPDLDVFPAWSRDGTKIAFTSRRNGNEDLFVMNAGGTGVTTIVTHPAVDEDPDWRP